MRTEVGITIHLRDKAVAKALQNSLKPDNVNLPEGLGMEMRLDGKSLIIGFSSTGRLESLISTVDDVLECCQLSTKVLEV